jgi:hypothetical protein
MPMTTEDDTERAQGDHDQADRDHARAQWDRAQAYRQPITPAPKRGWLRRLLHRP